MAKISVITICYNNLEGLKRTFDSVHGQTCRNEIEHIIIDGGSTDGSPEFLKDHAGDIDYWISEPDKGIYNAMNKGIAVATGEYCIFMNSGDLFASADTVEKCLPYLDGTDFVYGNLIEFFPKTGEKHIRIYPEKITGAYCVTDTLPHQATFIKTDVQKKNPYKETYKIVSDYVFFAEEILMKKVSIKKIPYQISIFYMDGISCTNNIETCKERYTAIEDCVPIIIVEDLRELKYYKDLSRSRLFRIIIYLISLYRKFRYPKLYWNKSDNIYTRSEL